MTERREGEGKRVVVWGAAAERLKQVASQGPRLRRGRNALGKAQSRDDKIALKLEEGRTYGMRQQFYDNKRKRDLSRKLNGTDLTEEHW